MDLMVLYLTRLVPTVIAIVDKMLYVYNLYDLLWLQLLLYLIKCLR